MIRCGRIVRWHWIFALFNLLIGLGLAFGGCGYYVKISLSAGVRLRGCGEPIGGKKTAILNRNDLPKTCLLRGAGYQKRGNVYFDFHATTIQTINGCRERALVRSPRSLLGFVCTNYEVNHV